MDKITYLSRDEIIDIMLNKKFIGSVTIIEGYGYSCGQQFHPTFSAAEQALIEREKARSC